MQPMNGHSQTALFLPDDVLKALDEIDRKAGCDRSRSAKRRSPSESTAEDS